MFCLLSQIPQKFFLHTLSPSTTIFLIYKIIWKVIVPSSYCLPTLLLMRWFFWQKLTFKYLCMTMEILAEGDKVCPKKHLEGYCWTGQTLRGFVKLYPIPYASFALFSKHYMIFWIMNYLRNKKKRSNIGFTCYYILKMKPTHYDAVCCSCRFNLVLLFTQSHQCHTKSNLQGDFFPRIEK